MWFCCISIGAISAIVIIMSLWEKFQTNPTITGLDTDFHNWDVSFPAITVCQNIPSNTSNIETYMENKNLSDSDNYENIKIFLEKLSSFSYDNIAYFKDNAVKGYIDLNTNLKQLAFQLITPCEEIFGQCDWKTEVYNCCDTFFPAFTESGFCYSFNSRHYEHRIPGHDEELPEFTMRYIQETDIKWSLKFNVVTEDNAIKFPIYIHNSDEAPGIDIQPQLVWDYKVDRVSFSVKQTYTTDDTRQLSIKQRQCVFEDEVKLQVDYIYTYTACARQCRMETSRKYCGCIPFFYPEIENFKHCKINELACIAYHLETIKSGEKCNCYLGCSNTVYEVEKLNEQGGESGNKELEAEFVSWPMVRYKREVLFGWVDLLVSFGGIAGLFLGFSLLSGVEIIYYFTIRTCCMVYKEPRELERLQRQEIVKTQQHYDLSLVPYFLREPSPTSGIQTVAKGYFEHSVNIFGKSNVSLPIKVISKNKASEGDSIVAPFGIEFLP